MRELIVFTVALCQGIQTMRFFPHYSKAGIRCGDEIQTDMGLFLPAYAKCDIAVLAQPGLKTVVDLFYRGTALDCDETPNAVLIIDENGETQSACSQGGSFLASSLQNFLIRVDDLPQGVKMHVSYVQPIYTCEETVSFTRMMGVPFTFEKNTDSDVGCSLIVPSGVNIEVQSTEPMDECDVRVEINQGRGLAKATQSTGEICVGKEPLKTEIYCGHGVVFLNGALGSQVTVTMMPPTKKETKLFALKKSMCP